MSEIIQTPNQQKKAEQPEKLYNFSQIKTAIIVFLNFIKNNPEIKNLYDTNFDSFMSEVITNPIFDDIIKNILSQSSQIAECMETGQNIKVNIGADNDVVEKVVFSSEDEKNIDEIIKLGFDANIVCKIYAEFSLSTSNNDENKNIITPELKKELTLKKLFTM